MNEISGATPHQASTPTADVDVWVTHTDSTECTRRLGWYESLLDAEETAKSARLRSADDRNSYVISHALVRTTLSRYVKRPPEQWRFSTTEYGRPRIVAAAEGEADLDFNLSHSRGLSACIVTQGGEVGIDVETMDRVTDPISLARSVFSVDELNQLASIVDASEQRAHFIKTWCLKEAYAKAIGLGLSAEFSSFSFVDSVDCVKVIVGDRVEPMWKLFVRRETDNHFLAAAVRHPGNGHLRIHIHELVPGREPTNEEIIELND